MPWELSGYTIGRNRLIDSAQLMCHSLHLAKDIQGGIFVILSCILLHALGYGKLGNCAMSIAPMFLAYSLHIASLLWLIEGALENGTPLMGMWTGIVIVSQCLCGHGYVMTAG